MRRLKILFVLVLFTAPLCIAADAEIAKRPEDLVFGTVDWQIPDAGALRFELDNGIPVYALADHSFPLVNVAVYFRGGRYLVPEGNEGLHAIAAEVWRTGGAGELSASELDEELDFLAAILSTNIGDVTGSVGLNVLTKDLDAAMALMMDVLTEPRFQEDRFAKAVDDLLQDMKTRNDNTASIEGREWSRLIYGEDYFMNRLATSGSVETLTQEMARDFVTSLIRSDNIILTVSGDFDEAGIKGYLEQHFGALPKLETALPAIPQPDHTPAPGVYVVNKEDVNQGRVSYGHLGYRLGDPQQFALMVGNDIVGGYGFTARMMKEIRSNEGLAYGAYSALGFPTTYPGSVRGFFQSKSSTCAYALQIGFELYEQMRSEPVTDEELTVSKNSFIETFPKTFASASQTVSVFAIDELLGRPHEYWTEYRDKVAAVDAGAITDAFEAKIHPDDMIVLVVGNVAEIKAGHPDHDARLTDFGEIRELPLRDPMTLEPIVE
ncbi:MAG: pitrilysin family protein [Thermoanaerobaculales bacterium]|jgi:predicted Zn-dependent peptidase|nr:pitrilysin family protein [Thermoanaerobaculales bacterium]